jgi:integrase
MEGGKSVKGRTWIALTERFLMRLKNEHTRAQYQAALVKYQEHLKAYDENLDPLTGDFRMLRDAIEDWAFSSTSRVKASTVASWLTVVRGFYKYVIDEDLVEELVKNPARSIQVWDDDPPRRLIFPDAELADRFELCLRKDAESGILHQRRDWLMFRFLTEGGFRASELCRIKLEDVDFVTGKVFIPQAKGDKNRTTAILVETCEHLSEFVRDFRVRREDYIFMPHLQYAWRQKQRRLVKSGATPISVDALQKMLKQGAIRHGFSEQEVKLLRRPHGYRHLWAVRHVAAGTGQMFIMLMGGWKSVDMLKYYINHGSLEVQAVARQ